MSVRSLFTSLCIVVAACSRDVPTEELGESSQALIVADRILHFEGTVGPTGDWQAVDGTATRSNLFAPGSGSKSLSLGGNWNPGAVSKPLGALGTLSGTPTINVRLPSGYQCQGQYCGQVALFVTCPSANLFNAYVGPTNLHGPAASFLQYTLPALPTSLRDALALRADCSVRVQLNLSNSGSAAVQVDFLSFGQGGSAGAGGTGGTAGGMGAAGGGTAGRAGMGGGGTSAAGGGGTAGRAGMGGGGQSGIAGSSGTAGTSGASGGSSGSAGRAGMGGGGQSGTAGSTTSAGTSGTSGASAGGIAGAGGASGSSGSSGSSDSGGSLRVEFFIDLPKGVARESIAIGTSGGALDVRDAFTVRSGASAFASISSVKTTTLTHFGVAAQAQNVWSEAGVFLANNAGVHGNLTTEGELETQTGAHVDGTTAEGTVLDPIRRYAWTVDFPSPNLGPANLEPNQSATITAGPHGGVNLKTGAVLTLASPGRYTFQGSIVLEPGSTLDIDNRFGGVELYATEGLIFRGQITRRDASRNNLLIGVAGSAAIPIESTFRGILIAPNADVTLATVGGGHRGSVFAKAVRAEANSSLEHEPFTDETCTVGSACDGRCQCDPGTGPCDDDGDCKGDVECKGSICGGPTAVCTTNSECAPGLTCSGGTCTDPCTFPGTPGCGAVHCFNGAADGDEWAIDCGPSCVNKNCRAPISPCTTNADCGPGTVCSSDALQALGLLAASQKICWNAICTSGLLQCGSSDKACGRCLCHPSCENKQCGDDLFDGCNEFCAPVCGTRDAGCKSDAECSLDNVCLQNAGSRFGLAPDVAVCVPNHCLDAGTPASDCGHPEDPCGTVCNPPAYVACQGMACGKDPKTGTECGLCATGSVCSIDNSCVAPSSPVSVRAQMISYAVGATPGAYSVNAIGKSTYRIPLRLPPAARGLTPDLELVFGDSAHMRGVLGPGWTLGGASRIHRCAAPSLQSSNSFGALDIRAQEPLSSELCLDGRQLRVDDFLTRTEHAPDNTIFKLADDDHSKIVRTNNNIGDLSFKVYKPDGTIYSYGTTATERRSVLPFDPVTSFIDVEEFIPTESWHLAQIRDRFGNTATFHYSSERAGTAGLAPESSITLTHIDYSGRPNGVATSSYQRRITFKYVSKDDVLGPNGGYFHLTPVDDNRLLESITVDTFDGAASHAGDRIYKITYFPTPGNGIQRVDSIQECAGSESVADCLPATTFKYDDAPGGDGTTRRFGTPTPGAIEVDHGLLNYIAEGGSKLNQALTLDVDGDGLKDLLHVNVDGSQYLRFWHAEGHSNGTVTFGAPVDIVGPKVSCVSGASIADLDGDGRDEIIDSCPVDRQKQQVDYFNIDASGVVTERVAVAKSIASAYIGDIDGNGRPDIIQETDSHIYFTDFTGYAADGSMQFGFPGRVDVKGVASPTGPGGLTRQPLMIDVDGDGTRNLMRFDPGTKQFYALRLASDRELTSSEKSQIAFDHAAEPGGEVIFITRIARWMPTGLSYQVSPLTGAPGHFDSIRVMDINGDGLEDVWVQSATLLAPLDPNLGRIPDILTGTEPNVSSEIVRINQLIGQLGGSIVESGPTQLWINVGGAFKLKGAVISTLDGHPPTAVECDVRAPDGACISRIPNQYFRDSTVMDYDNDGRDELIVPLGLWRRISLVSETTQRVYLAADPIPDLPNGGDLYKKDIDPDHNTFFYDLPVFADFNGDTNLDMLVAGYDNTPANRLMVMGTHQGSGRRLTSVTDGLGNTVEIKHSSDRSTVDTSGGCGGPFDSLYFFSYRPRCLRTVPTVVSEVTRGTVDGEDYGQTTYKYEHPATADFLSSFYFTARTIDEAEFVNARETAVTRIL